MFLKAVALAVSGPLLFSGLWSLDRASLVVLRGLVYEAPQQDGPDSAAEAGGSGAADLAGEIRRVGTSSSSTSPAPCAPCQCPPAAPDERRFSFAGRVVYRAAVAGDDELHWLVWVLIALYWAVAALCGWSWRACLGPQAGSRTSALAAERHRPRGAGYRAGLTPPRRSDTPAGPSSLALGRRRTGRRTLRSVCRRRRDASGRASSSALARRGSSVQHREHMHEHMR